MCVERHSFRDNNSHSSTLAQLAKATELHTALSEELENLSGNNSNVARANKLTEEISELKVRIRCLFKST